MGVAVLDGVAMTSSNFVLRRLTPSDLMRLGRVRPPAVTVLLPGEQSANRPLAMRVKHAVDSVFHRMLADSWHPHEIARLVAPALAFCDDPLLDTESHRGLALLLDRQTFSLFEVPPSVPEQVTVASTFLTRPLLEWLGQPREFLMLELGNRGVHLIRCSQDGIIPLPLPSDLPGAAGGFSFAEDTESGATGRDHCGRGKSPCGAISYSMGSANPERRLRFFCMMADRAMHVVLDELGLPLVVAGPESVVRAYRKENTYHTMVTLVPKTGLDCLPPAQLLEDARQLIFNERREEAVRHLVEMEEYAPGDRWSSSLEGIIRASDEGRVWRLFLNQSALVEDDYLGLLGRRNGCRPLKEDLLNAAAFATIVHGGEVFPVDPSLLPDNSPIAAIFR